MGIFETFSKRKRQAAKAGQPDVFQYTDLPQPFRVQVVHIWASAIGVYDPHGIYGTPPASTKFWHSIHDMLARERGVFHLGNEHRNPFEQCQEFLFQADVDGALDIIELTTRWIDNITRALHTHERDICRITQSADDAIEELNHRFREYAIGFEYVGGIIVRKDSQYLHAEVIKPALALLHEAAFQGPAEEFLKAHEHYRKGLQKEAVAEALKAFESTMKAICDAQGWTYPPTATATPLINVVLSNHLVPAYAQTHLTSLANVMQAGLPTVRNKTSGHGQGAVPTDLPDYLVAYALHLAGANICMLVEAYKALA